MKANKNIVRPKNQEIEIWHFFPRNLSLHLFVKVTILIHFFCNKSPRFILFDEEMQKLVKLGHSFCATNAGRFT